MELFLDCLPCLLRQVLEAARMASDDEAVQSRIMDDAVATLARHGEFATAPAMAAEMHALVRRHTGVDDPYAAIKARDLAGALRLVPLLERFVAEAAEPLAAALKVSATGNVMDSAIYADLDIEAVVQGELERPFAVADVEPLRAALGGGGTVLVIGDNAGEAVFDALLLRELARDHEVAFAVRATTASIHKHRLREWSESNEGPFPSLADSRQEAITEVAILCRALDTLVAITPAQISHAVDLLKPRSTWKGFDIYDV